MTGRIELYRQFADRFHAGKRQRSATEAQIETAESALGVLWPDAYREFALICGAVNTPALLELITVRKPGYSDVHQFLTPKQSVTETIRWRLEPAGTCVAIASDSSGNWFAFRDLPDSPRLNDAAVWLFDHDIGEVAVEAESFHEWIKRFLSL